MSGSRPRGPLAAVLVALAVALPALIPALSSASTGPPPTPVPPSGSLSPFPSVLATPAADLTPPRLTAPEALLANLDDGQVLFDKHAHRRLPIASLTKVMTALLVLERTHLDDVVTIAPDAVFTKTDYGATSIMELRAGEHLTVRDLMYGMLLGSANDAAVALAIDVSGSVDAFVHLMNVTAAHLGLRDTHFRSPDGLDDRGHSTAEDLLTLTRAAYTTPGFAPIVATRVREVPGPGDDTRTIQNRNVLLWLYPGAFGTKTGYTAAARYCLIGTAAHGGRRLIAIVMGAPSDAFSDSAALLNYGFAAFSPHTFVREGDAVGELAIRGGVVPVVAGGTIGGLVPTAAIDAARARAVTDPHAAFPPIPGEPVGVLRVSVPGQTVGVVPLRAAAIPVPVDTDTRPWWMRAGSAVAGGLDHALFGVLG